MCGRFTQFYTWAEVHKAMGMVLASPNLRPRYNIAPTTMIDVVVAGDGERVLMPMRWGLVPEWWKKSLKDVSSTFNARAETVATKPVYCQLGCELGNFRSNRCFRVRGLSGAMPLGDLAKQSNQVAVKGAALAEGFGDCRGFDGPRILSITGG
jgi:hypothetical protein